MAETTSRTLLLLSLLQAHREWAGPELAERLGVTERTLRRDIERVRELGYRIEATRGPAGGYRLEAGGQLPPLLLTDDEAVTMALGLRLAATAGLVDGELTTQTALAKFEQLLPSALRGRVAALASHSQAASPREATVSQKLLGALAIACRDCERIRFAYSDGAGKKSSRVVEPHGLVAASRNWFLVCWDLDRQDWRTFRVDRMSKFFGTRVRFPPRQLPTGTAAEFVTRSLGALRRQVRIEVVLQLPIAQARAAFGAWGRQTVAIDATTTLWSIEAESGEHAFGALAWIPSGVEYEVRADPQLLGYFRDAATRALAAATPR
jgi:predicted DNA-binding transcriptional regulator YafY